MLCRPLLFRNLQNAIKYNNFIILDNYLLTLLTLGKQKLFNLFVVCVSCFMTERISATDSLSHGWFCELEQLKLIVTLINVRYQSSLVSHSWHLCVSHSWEPWCISQLTPLCIPQLTPLCIPQLRLCVSHSWHLCVSHGWHLCVSHSWHLCVSRSGHLCVSRSWHLCVSHSWHL